MTRSTSDPDPGAPGWPRPRVLSTSGAEHYPSAWVNGSPDEWGQVDFLDFRPDHARAHTERLCCVCGDPLRRLVVLAASFGQRTTNAGWGHPVCVRLAVRTCPHFTSQARPVVAWLHDGSGIGLAEVPQFALSEAVVDTALALDVSALEHLARIDPWGEHKPLCPDVTDPTSQEACHA